MAEIKFSCPSCNQSIKCDELWGGHQIQCPSCQQNITVPQVQAAPAPAPAPTAVRAASFQPRGSAAQGPPPPPTGQSKLALGQTPGPASSAGKSGPVYRNYVAPKTKKSGPMKWVGIGAAVIALGVGGYFGYGWLSDYQQKANEKRRAVEKESDGGQVGHIANLYEVLDATENGRIEPIGKRGSTAPRQARPGSAGGAAMNEDDPDAPKASASGASTTNLPVIPPVWTLDLNAAKIPEARANGKISGTNFVVQTARLEYAGATPVLSLRQGTGPSPDREILVYLRLKAGEQLGSNSWAVSKEMKGSSVPQVTKRWKTNPKYAPLQKAFSTGYAMKLELGQINEGEVTGKIFVALPDPEQTVVAGIFTAATTAPVAGAPAAINPTAAPTLPPKSNPDFEARYGIKR